MKKIIFTFSFFTLIGLSILQAQEDLAKKGLDIATKAVEADKGFGSVSVSLKMVLKNKNGQTSERTLENKIFELDDDGDKSLIVFTSPNDIKGTATLTFTHKVGSDDQWLFLPAIQRTKRISSSNKSGPFVGSEFAYEDLSSAEIEKYTYKFLDQKGNLIFLEQIPVDPKSGYMRQVVTYNAEQSYRVEKIDFYDRKNSLLKTLTYIGYVLYKDKFWRANKLKMVNHQTNKETMLEFSKYDFDVAFAENDFTENALKRASN